MHALAERVESLSSSSSSTCLTKHPPTYPHAGKHVKVEPLHAVLTPELRHLLGAILSMVQDGDSSSAAAHAADPNSKVAAMLDVERALKLQGMVVAARELLSGPMRGGNAACHGRLRDVLFLDLALERTAKTSLESSLTAVRSAASSTMLGGLLSLLQQPLANAVLSAMPGQGGNASLLSVLRQLQHLTQECPGAGVCVCVFRVGF